MLMSVCCGQEKIEEISPYAQNVKKLIHELTINYKTVFCIFIKSSLPIIAIWLCIFFTLITSENVEKGALQELLNIMFIIQAHTSF